MKTRVSIGPSKGETAFGIRNHFHPRRRLVLLTTESHEEGGQRYDSDLCPW